MTYTDEQVAQYFIDYPGLNESQIAQVMSERGVSPEQVARVTGADPGYVSQRYDQYLDLVDQRTVRPFSGPPSPAVSPVVANPISLTSAGTASLGQPTNVSSPANVFSPADYGPPSPIFDPRPEPYVDTAAQNLLGQFDQAMDAAMASGDYANVANVMKEAEGLYGPATYTTVADYLNTNPRYEGLRGQVGGAAYTPENLQSFVSSIPAPVDPGIAGALPGGPGDTGAGAGAGAGAVPTGPAGALPAGPAGSVPAGPAGPGSAAASPSRVYQPTYTSYRQEGQAPFGGYYAQPGIGPYGGVFGVGTEQFEQQSDPFSGAQARAQEMIRNRISPSTVPLNFDASQVDPVGAFNLSMAEGRFEDAAQIAQRAGYSPDIVSEYVSSNRSGLNLPSDFSMTEQDFASLYSTTGFPRQPAAFGGSMSSMGTPSNPFIYRQSLSPLPLPVPEAVSVAETVPASEGSATMRRGGYINQGITAVRR
jgi:hypothetical protein